MKNMILKALVLAPALCGSIAQANLGGGSFDQQYNKGSYLCVDQKGELKGRFTFNAQIASLIIKGDGVILDCVSARNASAEAITVLKGQYFRPVDVCEGQAAKGNVIVATTNAMGNVQMQAFLVNNRGERLAQATLNCESMPTNNSGW